MSFQTLIIQETFFLQKSNGMSSKKVITWVETIQLDRILVLGHSDGSIEFRFRDSLESILSEGGLDRFCHLMQAGFRFNDVEPGQSLSSKARNTVVNV